MNATNTYTSRTPYRIEHPNVLAIYCSDGRFTRAVEDLAAALGHEGPLGALSRTHQELFMRASEFDTLRRAVVETGPTMRERRELRRALYGLHAILRLHNAQEEELFHELGEEEERISS